MNKGLRLVRGLLPLLHTIFGASTLRIYGNHRGTSISVIYLALYFFSLSYFSAVLSCSGRNGISPLLYSQCECVWLLMLIDYLSEWQMDLPFSIFDLGVVKNNLM